MAGKRETVFWLTVIALIIAIGAPLLGVAGITFSPWDLALLVILGLLNAYFVKTLDAQELGLVIVIIVVAFGVSFAAVPFVGGIIHGIFVNTATYFGSATGLSALIIILKKKGIM